MFLGLYSGIMMALMSPLLHTGFRNSTVWPENDPVQPIWALAYVARPENWLHHGGPFFTDAVYFPHGLNLLANTTSFGLAILLIPVTWILGPIGSFNLIMFVSPILSGAAMMWALRRYVSSPLYRGVGGLVWGFSPFALEAFYWGWPNFVFLVAPPLFLWFFSELLHEKYSSRQLGLIFGTALSLQVTVGAEVAALCVVASIGTVLVAGGLFFVSQRTLPGHLSWQRLRTTALWGVIGFAPLGLFVTGYATFGPSRMATWVWNDSFIKGAHSWSALVTNPVVTGRWDPLWFPRIPSHFYFGWPALLAFVAAVILIRRGLMLTMGVVALLGLWLMRGEAALLHPLVILWHLPVVRNIISGRFVIFTWFAFAVIVAVGLQELMTYLSRRSLPGAVRGSVAVALCVIVLYQPAHAIVAAGPWTVQSSRHDAGLSAYAAQSSAPRVVMTYPAVKSSASMIQQASEHLPLKLVGGWGPQTGFTAADDKAASFLMKAQHWLLPVPSRADLEAVNSFLIRRNVDAIVIPRHLNFPIRRGYMQPYQTVTILTYMYGPPEKLIDTWIWERPRGVGWRLQSTSGVLSERQWRRCAWGVGRFNPDGVPFCVAKALEN